MSKQLKIAFIGAGSLGFTRRLVQDILAVPEFTGTHMALYDINENNLNMVKQILDRDIKANNLPAEAKIYTDRKEALRDADYIVCCIRHGGLDAFELDIEIPRKYGIDQCVGDTLAPGGIMYGQRTIAEMLKFCKDIREVSKPDALLLNYSNPNAMNTWACNEYGKVKTIGLCHGVQHGAKMIAKALGISAEDFDYKCIGINHQTWYTEVRENGKLIPQQKIYEALLEDPEIAKNEKTRLDMFKRFGYFSTESNGHLSEYLAWYRKRPDDIENWIDLSSWITGESGGYLRVCIEERNWFDYEFPELLKKDPDKIGERSHEHASYIIEALETGRIYRGHFNVINQNHITNLPNGCVVEIPAYVDRNGINLPTCGDLPAGCAAVCRNSIQVQDLSVKAAVTGNPELLKQAMLLDPLTGAVCNPPEVWQMTDEMLVAQAQWLPQYAEYIPQARKNLEENYITPGALATNPAIKLPVRDTETIVNLRRKAQAENKEETQ